MYVSTNAISSEVERWGAVWLPQVLPYSVTSTDNNRFTFDQLNDVKSYFFIVLVFVKSRSHIFMDGRSMVSVPITETKSGC